MLAFDGELTLKQLNVDGELTLSTYDGEIFVGEVISSETHEEYHGIIEVIPQVDNNVVLNTANKIVNDDITVLPIPYYEVSNIDGTTVVIGG